MKETRFIGVVNGEKFDNVNDYNKAITKAIENGVLKSAESRTEVINHEETCNGCNCNDCEGDCQCMCNVNMLPGFDNEESVKNYIDEYVTNDSERDTIRIQELKEWLGNNLEGVIKNVHKMDKAALDQYNKDIDEVLNYIEEDNMDALNFIRKTEKTIADATNKLNSAKRALEVIKIWRDNYLTIKDTIKDVSGSEENKPTQNNEYDNIVQDLKEAIKNLNKSFMEMGIDLNKFDFSKL